MEFNSYLERDIAYCMWSRAFEDLDIQMYWGIASLFGEKEQYLYPTAMSYRVWKKNFRNVLVEAVGLDVFCVDFMIENYFGHYFDFY